MFPVTKQKYLEIIPLEYEQWQGTIYIFEK